MDREIIKEVYRREYEKLPFERRRVIENSRARANEIFRKSNLLKETSDLHPDNAGSENEVLWVEFIKQTIPDEFPVIRHGRIVGTDGERWPQLDILILRPGGEKTVDHLGYFPRYAVLAAFEVKLSLEKRHIKQAAADAALIKGFAAGSVYPDLEDAVKRELPYYGLIGTGLKRDVRWGVADLQTHTLEECACYEPKSALDFVFLNDVAFLDILFSPDPFNDDSLDCWVQSGNFFDQDIDLIKIPLIGLSLFLTKLIAAEKQEYLYLTRQYEFYDEGRTGSGRPAFKISRGENGITLSR